MVTVNEVGLGGYFQIILKKLWIVILITLIFTTASAFLSFQYIKPSYQAKVQLLIGDIGTIETYKEMIQSPLIMDSVSQELNSVGGDVEVSSTIGSQIILITVNGNDGEQVSSIANTIATTFKGKIVEVTGIDDVMILSTPTVSTSSVNPQIQMNISLAFMLSVLISLGIILLIEYINPILKTEEEVRKNLNAPILGKVSIDKIKRKKG